MNQDAGTRDNRTAHASSVYDAAVLKTIPYYEDFHQETLAYVRSKKPNVREWLDTGCGTGVLVEKALIAFPEAFFTLADPSQEMLTVAGRRFEDIRSRVRFLEPSGSESLPESLAGTFQVCSAIQCHHYLNREGRKAAISKCLQMLDRDGVFVIFENIRPFTSEGIEAGQARWKAFQMDYGRTEEEAEQHLKRFDVDYFPITIEEHLRLLRKVGFRSVELLWYSCMQAGFVAVK